MYLIGVILKEAIVMLQRQQTTDYNDANCVVYLQLLENFANKIAIERREIGSSYLWN